MAKRFNPAPGWPPAPEGWLPPDGWQPDASWPPAPAGWQTVVDDEPAMGAAPAAPSAKQGNWFLRHKVISGAGALILLFIIIGAIGGGGDPATDTTASSSTPTTATSTTASSTTTTTSAAAPSTTTSSTAPSTTTTTTKSVPANPADAVKKAVLKALGTSNRDIKPKATVKTSGKAGSTIDIRFASDENLTKGLTKDSMRIDVVNALQAVRKNANFKYKEVVVTATYELVDALGNSKERQVFRGFYPKATVDKINFDAFNFKNVDIIASEVYVHPAFQE